jgi:hypothetical protein
MVAAKDVINDGRQTDTQGRLAADRNASSSEKRAAGAWWWDAAE